MAASTESGPAEAAAHDPELGPDRSVTLGAVVDWLRAGDESLAAIIAAYRDGMPEHAADYVAAALERHFTERSS